MKLQGFRSRQFWGK